MKSNLAGKFCRWPVRYVSALRLPCNHRRGLADARTCLHGVTKISQHRFQSEKPTDAFSGSIQIHSTPTIRHCQRKLRLQVTFSGIVVTFVNQSTNSLLDRSCSRCLGRWISNVCHSGDPAFSFVRLADLGRLGAAFSEMGKGADIASSPQDRRRALAPGLGLQTS